MHDGEILFKKICSNVWRSRKATSKNKKLSSKCYLLGSIYPRKFPKSKLWLTTLKFRSSCMLTVQESSLRLMCQTKKLGFLSVFLKMITVLNKFIFNDSYMKIIYVLIIFKTTQKPKWKMCFSYHEKKINYYTFVWGSNIFKELWQLPHHGPINSHLDRNLS